MNITLTGASGFVGRHLIPQLLKDGHQLTALGRGRDAPKGVRFFDWDAVREQPPADSLADADAIIHLAGEPVSQRWSPEVKQRIVDSRIKGTRHIVHALTTQPRRPGVMVSASAVGYYGDCDDEVLTEQTEHGDGFLPEVCVAWEKEAWLAESLGIRVVSLRMGIVLGNGGALKKMLPAFKAGAGAKLASGRQWMSWIHIDDLIKLILFALDRREVHGPLNAVSPAPVRNSEFTQSLAETLKRPAFLFAPKFALKLMLGEMAEVMTQSQRAIPAAARKMGFEFNYPDLKAALNEILIRPTTAHRAQGAP